MFAACEFVSLLLVITVYPSHSFVCPQLRFDIRLRPLSITDLRNAPAVGNANAADNSNMVISGDSRVAATYARAKLGKMPLDLADILVTDPPYCLLNRRRTGGDLRDQKVRKKKIDDSDTVTRFENLKEYKSFTKEWLKPCIENGLKPGADVIIWTNTLGKQPITAVCNELGYNLCGEYLWAKRTSAVIPSPNSTKNEVLLRVYESALIFRKEKEQPNTNFQAFKLCTKRTEFAELVLGPSDPPLPWSVISGYHEEESQASHDHPCHKPFTALEPLLRAWTKPGDLVLDVFAGSGGILQAALKLGGRRVRGIETLPEWAAKANDAIRSVTRITPSS